MLLPVVRSSIIPRSIVTLSSPIITRSFHMTAIRKCSDSTNLKAIDLYRELIGVYSDQHITPSLKQHIVKGMFLTNDIQDMSNPVFRRLNSIIRQDPNLIDEEKLDLISSLNTNHKLFQTESNSSSAYPMLHDEYEGIQDLSIRDLWDNDNFLKKSFLTGSIVGISLFSLMISSYI